MKKIVITFRAFDREITEEFGYNDFLGEVFEKLNEIRNTHIIIKIEIKET